MCCAGLSRTSNLILHISLAFILYISYISSCAGSHTHAHPFEYMRAYITRVCRCTSCVCVEIAVSRAAARQHKRVLFAGAHMHYTRTHNAECKIHFRRTGIRIEWCAYLAIQVQHSRASRRRARASNCRCFWVCVRCNRICISITRLSHYRIQSAHSARPRHRQVQRRKHAPQSYIIVRQCRCLNAQRPSSVSMVSFG